MEQEFKPDYTLEQLSVILNIRDKRVIMSMIKSRGVKYYRTTNTRYGRPRVPRTELEKLRTSNFGNCE